MMSGKLSSLVSKASVDNVYDTLVNKTAHIIVRAFLNRYGVTYPRCTQCTICGRSLCSDSKVP